MVVGLTNCLCPSQDQRSAPLPPPTNGKLLRPHRFQNQLRSRPEHTGRKYVPSLILLANQRRPIACLRAACLAALRLDSPAHVYAAASRVRPRQNKIRPCHPFGRALIGAHAAEDAFCACGRCFARVVSCACIVTCSIRLPRGSTATCGWSGAGLDGSSLA